MTDVNPDSGAAPGLPALNRRALLFSAAPAALGLPALTAADGQPESEIMRLFREWKAYLDWSDGPENASITDEESNRQGRVRFAIEHRIFAIPSRDARDVLAKILVITLLGEVCLGDDDGEYSNPIIAEARRFVLEGSSNG